MYEGNQIIGAEQAKQSMIAREVDYNPTVGENLDRRIAHLEHELAQAKASRETLGPLLSMRIRDLRRAMDY
jgi:hypothetical protein